MPPAARGQLPSFVDGDRISGRPDLETVVEGNASLRRGDTVINADRLEYYQPDDLAKATGNVRVNQAGNVYEGPGARNSRSRPSRASSTTCATASWRPAATATPSASTSSTANVSVARRRHLHHLPARGLSGLDAGLDAERGHAAPPTPRKTSASPTERAAELHGHHHAAVPERELSAQQRPQERPAAADRSASTTSTASRSRSRTTGTSRPTATRRSTPTLMSKRGVNLGTEFRYLEKGYSGEVRVDYMPSDALRDRDRWGIWTTHSADLRSQALRARLAQRHAQHQPRERQRLLARLHAHAVADARACWPTTARSTGARATGAAQARAL